MRKRITSLSIFLTMVFILILGLYGQSARSSASAQATVADLIVVNGKIVTVDKSFSIAEAVAVKDGKFMAVGTNAEINKLAGPQTRQIDVKGKSVLPGLIDGHAHVGRTESRNLLTLNWPRSIKELAERVDEYAQKARPGEWLRFDSDWHPSLLKEQTFPTRWDLDPVTPNNPVFIIRGGQTAVFNSYALKLAKVTKDTQPPEGLGVIYRDKNGEPTGVFLANARYLVTKVIPRVPFDLEKAMTQIKDENKFFSGVGVTSIRNAGLSPDEIRAYQQLWARGELTVRTNMMFEPPSRELPLEDVLTRIREFGPVTGFGDEILRIGGLKLYADGGMESAFLKEPYINDSNYYGVQNYTKEKLTGIVKEANRLGWSVGVHAVGDAAIELTLDAFEAANAEKSIAGKRWALEHPFLIVTPKEIERVKRLGVIASAQGWHIYRYGYPMVQYWGLQRSHIALPIRRWLDSGVFVASGTDQSPASVKSNIEFLVMWAEITRQSEQSGVLGADQKITRAEAVRLHTINPAYLSFEENIKGSIEAGKLADLVVISDDILACPEEKIKDIQALLTIVDGKIVYKRENTGL